MKNVINLDGPKRQLARAAREAKIFCGARESWTPDDLPVLAAHNEAIRAASDNYVLQLPEGWQQPMPPIDLMVAAGIGANICTIIGWIEERGALSAEDVLRLEYAEDLESEEAYMLEELIDSIEDTEFRDPGAWSVVQEAVLNKMKDEVKEA